MAEKIIRLLFDDMEGAEVEADAGTLVFGLDNRTYEIDLSKKNATKLRNLLQPFIDAARPAGSRRTPSKHSPSGRKSGAPSGYDSDQLKAIREWARKNGHPNLGDKGRIPRTILEAFENSHRNNDGEKMFSALT